MIPKKLRDEFEELGEGVVAGICGRPYTHAAVQTPGVPSWASDNEARHYASLWLRELQDVRNRQSRRIEIGTWLAAGAAVAATIVSMVALVRDFLGQ